MTLLLDTHLLLWVAGDPERLSSESQDLLGDPATELMFSTASIWEIVIKKTLGRSDFRVEPRPFTSRRGQHMYGFKD